MKRGNLLLWVLAGVFLPWHRAWGLPAAPSWSGRAVQGVSRAASDTVPGCCAVVRIDTVRLRVTARELATGFTFVFEVKSRRLLRSLKVGRTVWADFARRTVRLTADAPQPCCVILPTP